MEEEYGKGVVPLILVVFEEDFLGWFFSLKRKEVKTQKFLTLGEGSMIIREYTLKFTYLSH